MYATEKYVKLEAKELHEKINEVANDLGGDVKYLYTQIQELQELVISLKEGIEQLTERKNV